MNEGGPNGLLVIDKPGGPTSHDVVQSVRLALGVKRVGHAGTLDPSATGVLLVAVGRATRLAAFLQNLPKVYRGRVQFGVTTNTQDADGETVEERPCGFSLQQLEETLEAFRGPILQTPPMVSALKVGGEALYKAARRGEEVERKPRQIRVYELELENVDLNKWQATIRVACSSGTYIRTLAADIGDRLGCGAHIASLRRLSVGSFTEEQAVSLDALSGDHSSHLLTPVEAMRDFPKVVVDSEGMSAVSHGMSLEMGNETRPGEISVSAIQRSKDRPPHEAGMTAGIPVAVVGPEGNLLAVYRKTRGHLRPAAVLT